MQKKQFYLYARKRKDQQPVFYVKYRTETGILSPVCTGETDRNKALEWAAQNAVRMASDERERQRRPKGKTFKEWAVPWWKYDTCPYIREKVANGYNISRFYAEVRFSVLHRHLIPEFGEYPLSALNPKMFRDYKMRLFNEGRLKPASINSILSTARVMLGYAVKMGELESNPMAPIEELKETPLERGILTMAELGRLFGSGSLDMIWKGEPRYYALNLLAASTGMRMGECQAVRVKDISESGFIDVAQSWDDRHGFGPPKWGSRRFVPVPTKAAGAISDLLALKRWGEPQPEDVVFWGMDRQRPVSKHAILHQFKVALGKIGIAEEERARRVLVFHSYRHGYETMMRGRVPDEQLRRVTGHKTIAMSDNYDHAQPEHLADVKAAQESLFAK